MNRSIAYSATLGILAVFIMTNIKNVGNYEKIETIQQETYSISIPQESVQMCNSNSASTYQKAISVSEPFYKKNNLTEFDMTPLAVYYKICGGENG